MMKVTKDDDTNESLLKIITVLYDLLYDTNESLLKIITVLVV